MMHTISLISALTASRIASLQKGAGTKIFNCNDKQKTPDQDTICSLLGKSYSCSAPTTTTKKATTTTIANKVCPTFQELLEDNMPKLSEDYYTNQALWDEELLDEHLSKDHPELSPNYVPPPPKITEKPREISLIISKDTPTSTTSSLNTMVPTSTTSSLNKMVPTSTLRSTNTINTTNTTISPTSTTNN